MRATHPHNRTAPPRSWNLDQICEFGLTTDITTAALILGIGRSTGYELARIGTFPVKVIRVGHRYLVPTTALIKLLQAE